MKKMFKTILVALLTWEARAVLHLYKPKVIAITGTLGKTSTKDAIFATLEGQRHVRKSEKSFNSEIGVPLTILGFPNGWSNPFIWIANLARGLGLILLPNHYPKWLILEVGADKPGDIKRITKWLKVDVAVITGIPDTPVHIEQFESVDEVTREKEYLAKAVTSGGTLILNGDNPRSYAMKDDFRGIAVTYGFSENNHFSASHAEIVYANGKPTGVGFRVNHAGSSVPVVLRGAIGRVHAYPALAAMAVGKSIGLDIVTMSRGLSSHPTPVGRMRIIEGIKNSTIIDDSYNASPDAVLSALDTLEAVTTKGRKVAALGDMRELGEHSKEAHMQVGKRAAEVLDVLITVGEESKVLAEAALNAGMPESNVFQYEYEESQRAGKEYELSMKEGDIVLVKGSQNKIRMERFVKEIMGEPLRAQELLVRQEREWLAR